MLQTFEKIFPAIWTTGVIISLVYFFITGKKALQLFPPISTVKVNYRYKFGSGYSLNTNWLKRGGASNVLDVVVTDKELWLKTMTIFAGLAQRVDLLHKIPLENILHTETKGVKIIVNINTDTFENKQVAIIIKNPELFIQAIKQRPVGK